jgi:hypothetical protein
MCSSSFPFVFLNFQVALFSSLMGRRKNHQGVTPGHALPAWL